MIATTPVLDIRDLNVDYVTERGAVRAVDNVSLDVGKGEFLGIVGESGCGKSTLLFAIARLLSPPAEIASGSVHFKGTDMVIHFLRGKHAKKRPGAAANAEMS